MKAVMMQGEALDTVKRDLEILKSAVMVSDHSLDTIMEDLEQMIDYIGVVENQTLEVIKVPKNTSDTFKIVQNMINGDIQDAIMEDLEPITKDILTDIGNTTLEVTKMPGNTSEIVKEEPEISNRTRDTDEILDTIMEDLQPRIKHTLKEADNTTLEAIKLQRIAITTVKKGLEILNGTRGKNDIRDTQIKHLGLMTTDILGEVDNTSLRASKVQGNSLETVLEILKEAVMFSDQSQPCDCNLMGSVNDTCDPVTKRCPCFQKYTGRLCNDCKNGLYNFPKCTDCQCNVVGTYGAICNKYGGECLCKDNYRGAKCDECKTVTITGSNCDRCIENHFDFPNCKGMGTATNLKQ